MFRFVRVKFILEKNVIIFFSIVGKYIVISCHTYEIVDLFNPSAKYELLANNVPTVKCTTGGLLQSSPVFCQESYYTKSRCYVIGKPEMKMEMLEERPYTASVTLNQKTLWIVGGYTGNGMSSTEFLTLGQPSVKGPDLPFKIFGHSMIQYDEKSIYIIGGRPNSFSNKTWIVDPTNEFRITEGPSLKKGRAGHGCAKMTINGRTILVVAGGFGAMDSVEILDPQGNNVWTPGMFWKSITVELC